MIGRTNACAGGKMNSVSGTFTASKTATQKSFTVQGLTFEPKVIAIKRTSISEGSIGPGGSSSLLICAFTDLESRTGFYTEGNDGSGKLKTTSCLSVSGGDGTYTVTSAHEFSFYDSSTQLSYGKFAYYIYG